MSSRTRKLGEVLLHWGRINQQQLEEGLRIAESSRRQIGDVLVEFGYAHDVDVAQALGTVFGMDFVDLEQPDAISQEMLGLMPIDLIKKYHVLPLGKIGNHLKILVHDPRDLETLDSLRFRLGCEIETAVGSRRQIKEFIDRLLGQTEKQLREAVRDFTKAARKNEPDPDTVDIHLRELLHSETGVEPVEANAAPVIRLVESVICEAVEAGASDIHIEPMANRVRLRFRIDGVCVERNTVPKRAQLAVCARLKIMAGVKLEERRVPQDGRLKLKINGQLVEFRFSCCPGIHGESIVMRILRPDAARLSLDKLGLRPDTREAFNRIIKRPNGIFFVTGPTGSGKTTTLYSALNELNRPDRKIVTAEDPVEYSFKGINQCQIQEGIGLTFANALRAMLRHAPQIVLVGEVRDKEVADVAIQAALTGHLVFSTLHTNDAPSAITRLIDMGVKPFLVASAVQAVLAQRLVRVLCADCKAVDENPGKRAMQLCDLSLSDFGGRPLYRAVGCAKCGGTGYRGRQGIHEMMVMNSELRVLAFKRAPINQLRSAAAASGMRNLLGAGRLLVIDGQTTPDEVSRIAQIEGTVDVQQGEFTAA